MIRQWLRQLACGYTRREPGVWSGHLWIAVWQSDRRVCALCHKVVRAT